MKRTIDVNGTEVVIFSQKENDYISLTDIARYKDTRTDDIIKNWLRNRTTIEFLGIWETINNPHFKPVEFDWFRKQAGLNSFVLTAKQWITKTSAIGIISKPGRYGGTYAHKDIAFEFATWISVTFKLYLIKEFQRLKIEENKRESFDWDLKRNLAKINYQIHTDAIRTNLIPPEISRKDETLIYANEADLLNKALFGQTAKEWKATHQHKKGNIRDYAEVLQLVELSNLENLNAEFIKEGIGQFERLLRLNKIAISQMNILIDNENMKLLGAKRKK